MCVLKLKLNCCFEVVFVSVPSPSHTDYPVRQPPPPCRSPLALIMESKHTEIHVFYKSPHRSYGLQRRYHAIHRNLSQLSLWVSPPLPSSSVQITPCTDPVPHTNHPLRWSWMQNIQWSWYFTNHYVIPMILITIRFIYYMITSTTFLTIIPITSTSTWRNIHIQWAWNFTCVLSCLHWARITCI